MPRPEFAPFAFKSEQSVATHEKMLIIKVSGKRYNIFMLHAASCMNHHKAEGGKCDVQDDDDVAE